MKKVVILIFWALLSCSNYIEKPDHLISKSDMAEIMADLAINDQAITVNPNANIEVGTRQILLQHKVSTKDFIESYKYYAMTKKMAGIVEKSQDIVKNKNEEAKKFIEERTEANKKILSPLK